MNNAGIKTIGKYALILTVCYLIDIAAGYLLTKIIKDTKNDEASGLLVYVSILVEYLLNIVTAVIISFDKNKFTITGKYSVLLTIFYRPIGVVLFLIYLINSETESSATHKIGS